MEKTLRLLSLLFFNFFSFQLSQAQGPTYCSPKNGTTLHSSTGPSIDSVVIIGTTLSNSSPGVPTNGYTLFPATGNSTASLEQSKVYVLQTTFSATAIASVWFDWNQDGKYDATEWTQITTSGSGTQTTSITVPSNAIVGLTGMRVRSRLSGNANGATNACTTFGSGETEEYIVTISSGVSCTGKPTAGYAFAPSLVCPNSIFALIDTGYSTGVGISYQWETSLDSGISWTSIIGDTLTTDSTSISQKTWFRLKATCNTSKDTSFSNIVVVDTLPLLACSYCSPNDGTTLHAATGPTIESVSIVGTTLNNSSPGTPNSGYSFFAGTPNTTATLQSASQYTLTTTFSAPVIASVWFDWNQDGAYDASEWTQITTTAGGTVSTTITVPGNALVGKTGMRVRARNVGNPNAATDACTTFGSGETEEYLVNIIPGLLCKGKPTAGYAFGPSSVCPNAQLVLTDSGYSTGAVGISFQWQTSIDSGLTWSNTIGDTLPVVTTSISQKSWFRFKTTCTTTSDTAYSNIVTVDTLPVLACSYCSPDNGTTLHAATGPTIDAVSIVGTTLNNSSPGTPNSGYTFFSGTPNTTATIQTGVQYNLSTTFSGSVIASVWFDWNQDGLYDATEWTQITTTGAGTITTPISVPGYALSGKTGMRIRARSVGNPNASTDACTTFGSGETEEYLVNIVPGTFCKGKPNPGFAIAPSSVCPSAFFSLVDTGSTFGLGISYQWQTSLDSGATWSIVSGDSTPTATASISQQSWFRFSVVCNATNDSAFSNTVVVGLLPQIVCQYCSPNNGTTLHAGTSPGISAVSISGTTLNNATTSIPTNGYTLFPDASNTTAVLIRGVTYTLSTNFTGGLAIASVWLDWNQDGVFDASEWTQITQSDSGFLTTDITVPTNALVGKTGMRIRTRASGNINGAVDACTTFGSGETQDYIINISPIVACSTKPVAGTIIGNNTVCPNTSFTLTDTGYSTSLYGLYYQWQVSLDSGTTWSIVDTMTTTHKDSLKQDGWYKFVVGCTLTGDTSSSSVFYVSTKCVTPVTMLPLKAIRKNHTNILQWATAQENNNSGFEVYRSINGYDFLKIGNVESLAKLGNSTKRLEYQYEDATEEPKSYYKIKQVDFNGTSSFSNVVIVKASSSTELQLTGLYPNPVANSFNIDISAPSDMKANVIIYDMVGKVVSQNNINVNNGNNHLNLSTNGLASGSYILKCIGQDGNQSNLYKFYKK